jgi:acetylornithine deacetylase/succinyl-diaminopimelate desuccinylase-like protein
MYEITLLKKLVSFNTNSQTKENYKQCAEFIAKECKRIGLKVKIINPKAKDGKPRPNIIAVSQQVWQDIYSNFAEIILTDQKIQIPLVLVNHQNL